MKSKTVGNMFRGLFVASALLMCGKGIAEKQGLLNDFSKTTKDAVDNFLSAGVMIGCVRLVADCAKVAARDVNPPKNDRYRY